ncbi:hypothetical protein TcWFU_006046 [Taenia crassiceps]|uniref:G-protein coupled receptors family 2 profile 2 domain-containing protein n=1 Tax=Taenia crassiceps TaxID=6207 RepID=A0ABR4QRP6_9CEST
MFVVVTHIALLLVPQVCGETMSSDKLVDSRRFGIVHSRGNASADEAETYSLANPMLQCIGVMRGLLFTAGVHLEPRVVAIGRCPPETPSTLMTLCSTDIPAFPPEVGSIGELQNQLLSKLKTGNRPNLGPHLNLAIRQVSPVIDSDSGDIYANIYCAQCHNISSSKRIKRPPKRLLCTLQEDAVKCFVQTEMPKKVNFCEPDTLVMRAFFTWDSIFTLPDEDESNAEKSLTKSIFELSTVEKTTPRQNDDRALLHPARCTGRLPSRQWRHGLPQDASQTNVHNLCLCPPVPSSRRLRLDGHFCCRIVSHFRTARDSKTKAVGMMLRARGLDPNPNRRFKHQVVVATILPLCFTIPTLVINEYIHLRLKPLNETGVNGNWSFSSHEAELGSTLYRLYPGFCPINDPNYAWFKGHHIGLLAWFLIPAGVTICFNLFALIVVCIQICRLKRETGLSAGNASPQLDAHMKPSKSVVAVCTKLAVILGASWFIQLLAGLCPQMEVLRQLAGLVNSAQGGIIAVSMLASSKARRVMAQRLPAKCREALGVSEPTSRSTQEMTTSARSRSRLTDQINSQTTSLLPSLLLDKEQCERFLNRRHFPASFSMSCA